MMQSYKYSAVLLLIKPSTLSHIMSHKYYYIISTTLPILCLYIFFTLLILWFIYVYIYIYGEGGSSCGGGDGWCGRGGGVMIIMSPSVPIFVL